MVFLTAFRLGATARRNQMTRSFVIPSILRIQERWNLT